MLTASTLETYVDWVGIFHKYVSDNMPQSEDMNEGPLEVVFKIHT